jgi:apolipoprotein N-acyltransferase
MGQVVWYLLLSCALGVATVLSVAPLYWWWIEPLLLAAFLALVLPVPRATALFCYGLSFGIGMGLGNLWWIPAALVNAAESHGRESSDLIAVAVLSAFALLTALPYAVATWAISASQRLGTVARPLAIAAAFTACEFFSPHVLEFTLALPLAVVPAITLASAALGLPWLVFLVVLTASGLAVLLRARAGRIPLIALLASAWIGTGGVAALMGSAPDAASTLRVAAVQHGLDHSERHQARLQGPERYRAQVLGQTRRLLEVERQVGRQVDLVVWPETADIDVGSLVGARDQQLLANTYQTVIAYGVAVRMERGVANEAQAIQPDGRAGRDGVRHRKTVLFPMSEWPLPFPWSLLGLDRIGAQRGIQPGTVATVLPAGTVDLGYAICHEGIFVAFIHRLAQQGASVIAVGSLDDWFGERGAPQPHLGLARLAAAQVGLPVIRSSSTGPSALVDFDGRIVAETHNSDPQVLVGDITIPSHSTRGPVVGYGFAVVCLVFTLVLIALRRVGIASALLVSAALALPLSLNWFPAMARPPGFTLIAWVPVVFIPLSALFGRFFAARSRD